MSYNIATTPRFERESKYLIKKYPSLKTEILELTQSLEIDPIQGTALGRDCFKIRLAIKSKGKGKSGGARIIICVKVVDNIVYLLSIFDKSVKDNLTEAELRELLTIIK
jgi:mRNA-degrading endonuclease RelE of RelBE toxin-antitoxin system